MTLQISDDNRVRTLTLNRPDVLNAFNEELYNATAVALREAATDPDVAVVLLTGAGRAFSAGNDLNEMQRRITDPAFNEQKVCEPDELLPEARRHAEILASRPIPSLMAVKQTIVEPTRTEIAAASAREIEHFAVLLGAAANADALAEFTDKRQAN